jgi:predicted Zn-dependent peptidase
MVQDDPEDLVQELHSEQMLNGHPLGRPILGRIATIERLDRVRLVRYRARHYHPRRIVVAAAGNVRPDDMLSLLTKEFGSFAGAGAPSPERWPARARAGVKGRRKPLEQVHLSIGFPGLPMGHKDRYAAHALNAVLGGSVSSRLFEEIREKRALAYSIYSYLATFSDSGTWTVYAATRPAEAARVVELICRELRRLRRGVPKAELARAKQHMKGSVILGLEGTTSRMSKLAKDALFEGRHRTLGEIIADIERVSEDQIARVAHELIDLSNLSISALGSISETALRRAIA